MDVHKNKNVTHRYRNRNTIDRTHHSEVIERVVAEVVRVHVLVTRVLVERRRSPGARRGHPAAEADARPHGRPRPQHGSPWGPGRGGGCPISPGTAPQAIHKLSKGCGHRYCRSAVERRGGKIQLPMPFTSIFLYFFGGNEC